MLYAQPAPENILTRHGRPALQALPREFTVCSWNWQKSKRPGWAEEFRALAAAADLFLAQEVRRSPEVRAEMDQTEMEWNGAVSFLSLKGKHPVGVATGSRAAAEHIAFKQGAREPVLRMPKMALSALIPLETGRKLLAVNVHAINFTGFKPFEANLARAAELLLGFDGPVVLGGDFNSWNQKRRNALSDLAVSAGLCEVPFEPDGRTRCLGRPVDFLFTRGLTVRAAGVRRTDHSDHNPLLARLYAP